MSVFRKFAAKCLTQLWIELRSWHVSLPAKKKHCIPKYCVPDHRTRDKLQAHHGSLCVVIQNDVRRRTSSFRAAREIGLKRCEIQFDLPLKR